MPHIAPLPIGTSRTGQSISLKHEHLTGGLAIVGISSADKTNLLRRITTHWLAHQGNTATILDPIGNLTPALTNDALHLDYNPSAQQPRVNLLDPTLKPDYAALETITASIAAAVGQAWDNRREDILRYFIQLGLTHNLAVPDNPISLQNIFNAISSTAAGPPPPILTQRLAPPSQGTHPGRWLQHFLDWPTVTRDHALQPLSAHLNLITPSPTAVQALSHESTTIDSAAPNVVITPSPHALGHHAAALIGSFLAHLYPTQPQPGHLLACEELPVFPALQHSQRAEPSETNPVAATMQSVTDHPPLLPELNRTRLFRTWAVFLATPDTLAHLRNRYLLADTDLHADALPRHHFTLITDAGLPTQQTAHVRPLPNA